MGLSVSKGGPPMLTAPRRLCSTVLRLRCSKALTKSTLYQLKAVTSPMCELCGDYDDVIHVLDKCKKYSKQRLQWVKSVKKAGNDGEVLNI